MKTRAERSGERYAKALARQKTTKQRRATVRFQVKSPDAIGALVFDLSLDSKKIAEHFEFGEYATIEVEVDENLKIVGGRIVPLKET